MDELTLRLSDTLLVFLTVGGSWFQSTVSSLDVLQSRDGRAILERCIGGFGQAAASTTLHVGANSLLPVPASAAAGETR